MTWSRQAWPKPFLNVRETTMFTIDDRNRIRDYVLAQADADARIVAGAVVGSLAHSDGDRWSDLDFAFGVVDTVPVRDVLDDFSADLVTAFDADHLFDLPSGAALYRIFLLPGCLQLDISVAPASQFGALGPAFRLLFGQALDVTHATPPEAEQLFGYAVHHLLRARFCIERGRYWQAHYWINSARDHALALACHHRDLPARYGRGFDALPESVKSAAANAIAGAVDRQELLRALGCAIELLLGETQDVQNAARRIQPRLRELTAVALQ